MVQPHTIVELREGGDVRAALVLADEGGRLRLLTAEGRELRVPQSRVVHETGETLAGAPGGVAGLAAALGRWEADAQARSRSVDLGELHELFSAQAASGAEIADLTLSDLAMLSLGEDTPAARAAVHRAMAGPNPWFRFTGRTWLMRTAEEAEQELANRRRTEEVARARAAVLDAAKHCLAGVATPLPLDAAKFLRPLREVALLGDAAPMRKEAAALVAELHGGGAPKNVAADEAFELLVGLGVFSRDENLALLRAGVRVEFPPEVVEEARGAATQPIDLERRRDLRHLEVVTIDDASTTEIDDGLSLERIPDGWRLGIHVSDAAHHVGLGSLTDQEALTRGTSYYLPERSIAMLPSVISEDAASLVEGKDRPAMSFFIDVSAHGERLRAETCESVIRVARRMTYEDCEAVLAAGAADDWLRVVAQLADALEAERLAAGAAPIRAPELLVEFDAQGEPETRLVDPGRPARKLVSEMMILANRVAATWCRDRGLPAIYRRQPPPSGHASPPPRDRHDPVAIHDFRRSLQRTEISLEPGPHSGLGLPCYLQATSPIRRYQDLAVHRVIKSALRGEPCPYSRDDLRAVAATTEQAGRQARQVENETDLYWILRCLEGRTGDVVGGVVVRSEDRRTLVELDDYARAFFIAHRPDHERGRVLRLRVRSVRPRRGSVTFEEIAGA